jgi:phosphoglycolate phosphatase-like HAD superfamily hydrolase
MTELTVLCWDIDGTLLTTARAGIHAWEEAVEELIGAQPDFDRLTTAGLTDVEIARALLAHFGREVTPEATRALVRAYETRLPAALPRRTGQVLPNVREILEALRGRADVHSLLLTGNTRAGARAKLERYGLAEFFDFDASAFSDGTDDRPSIAREALRIARALHGEAVAPERVYVIGDTPHDVRCGEAIGARVIAVATGGYTVDDLERLGPWWTVPELPAPAAFLERLGLAAAEVR